jgi:GrpB-like predicted nucleotidyltransferase (UPF0157 family)
VLIQAYQSKWKDDFEAIKNVLIKANEGMKLQIEYIGSTAIPGMPAKSIIDIDLIYFSIRDFTSALETLETIGYYHNGDQGIEGREVFKRNEGENHPLLDTIKHHLYVCHHQSRELKRHLLFRDYLRNNKDARAKYAKLKHVLAKKAFQDKNIYALLKEQNANDFIDECIKKQEIENGK